jgi:hypothetical protein
MLRNELEERLGHPLLDWQWTMAHEVYQNHKEIPDVGGKDLIAKIIREMGGFEHDSSIRTMYRSLGDKSIVVKTVVELLETYDVDHKGYCINSRGNRLWDILKKVQETLKKDYPGLMDQVEYFDVNYDYNVPIEKRREQVWDVHAHWNIIHYVTGGSEGFYVHVAQVHRETGVYHTVFLIKTLIGNEKKGRDWCDKMCSALAWILQV